MRLYLGLLIVCFGMIAGPLVALALAGMLRWASRVLGGDR